MDRAYSYEELGELKAQILDICERVRQDNPTAWSQAHNGNFDETSTRYNDLCVQALRAAGIFAGCNGKRGGEQRSDDVLTFGLTDGRGAGDASGRFPSIAIIDYITGAGGRRASIGWGDVSAASGGRFLDPQGLARVDGGGSTPPPSESTPPPPVSTPPPSVAPPVDLSPVLARLDAIAQRLAILEEVPGPRPGGVPAYIDAMLGAGPGDGLPNHVTDIKQRLDRVSGEIDTLSNWLRSCRVLRF